MTVPRAVTEWDAGVPSRLRYEVLERRCHEMGATTDVARGQLLGVTRHTVMRWRHGHHGISMPVAARIAQIIGVRLDQLIDAMPPGTPPPSPPPPQPPRPPGPPTRDTGERS